MKKRIFFVLAAMILLLGAFSMSAAAAEGLADVYVATTGLDTNAGTEDAPVLSLNQALVLVQDGGTVHIVDSYIAPAGFVWDNHNKDVTITGGKLDLSQGYSEGTDGGAPFYYYAQGDAVTYDNLELVLADDLYYFANGFRLQINENVTISGKDLQLFGGGFKTAVDSTNMKLLGGSYLCDDGYASIYGGGFKANVNGDINLYVGNINPTYTTSHDGKTRLYGGGYVYSGTNQIYGDINLTVAGANVDYIMGVSHVSSAVSGDVNVTMSGGSAYSLYGGSGGTSTIAGDINLTVTGGTIAQIFGANEGASHQGNVNVYLMGGTITRRFLGGCYNNYSILSGYSSDCHVTGNIDVYLYEGMNLAWNTSEDDAGFYAHSRYNPVFDDEVTTLYYMGTAAQTKHADNLGAQNSGMSMVMGSSTTVADTVTLMPTQVEKWNVVLCDDIGANFYVKVPVPFAETAVLNVTVAGATESYDLSDAEDLYQVSVHVAAAQMTENIKLQLVVDGVEYEPVSYTIRDYAETILTGEYAEDVQALVKHMLNYGAAAQTHFGVNTDNMANADYVLGYEAEFPAEYLELAVNGEISGVKFYGASLIMDSKIALRYYFTADSVEGVAFSVNGQRYTATEKSGLFYVEVPGINPYEYANSFVITAVKGEEKLEVAYSPMSYIVRMSQKGSDTMKPLVNALYGYYETAVAYVKQYGVTVELPAVTGGTVTADKLSCLPGGTVTAQVTPDARYYLTGLTVKLNGEAFKTFETALEGGSYTFPVADAGTYTVEATFVCDTVIKAHNADQILWSAAVKYSAGAEFVERGATTGLYADDPRIDNLLTAAPGKFNASGTEWPWIAYKISVPEAGTYKLGVTTNSAKEANFKIPMVVNHQVYTLTFNAKAQEQIAEVTLPAGEHIVTVFWPMPANESEIKDADWNTYLWANIASVTVDYKLTASKATVAEVEAYMVPNTVIAAADAETVLHSAAMGDNGGFLEFNSRDAVKADLPYIESIYDDAPGQFNASGAEWGWFAYKVTAPADGVYTLTLQNENCRNAPYYMPVCVDNEVYTLSYAATGRLAASAEVALSAGEHTVVIFMPMPINAAGSTGEDWVDYPWCNPETITVDGLLSVSKPTAEEVVACFDTIINAYDAENILLSTSTTYTEGNAYVARGDTTGLYADDPRIDTLLTVAPGKFNAEGNVWPWMAYKISVPEAGTYTLGVTTESAKWANFKIPMVVNHQVYTLTFNAKAQEQTIDVTLPAGEHIVTVFWPMPANESEIKDADWNTYQWANIASVTVDNELTVSLPTAEEVETYMVPNKTVAATDTETVLYSAAMGDNGGGFLEFNSRDAVKADLPYIDSLQEDAIGEFNKSGEEWGWIAYKVTAPADGTYTLTLQNQSCRVAPYYMPLYVNDEIYELYYSATGAQSASVEVTLSAGEHTVVIFMPMPVSAASSIGEAWRDYPWCNPQTITVDALLTVSLPTVEEVEACFAPDVVISAMDTASVLTSATVNVTETYLGRKDQATLSVDLPAIESLYTDASGQFNKSGEEWNWFAYKVTAPKDGTYTLGVKTESAKFASYKIPLCVNGQVYTLQYTESAQLVTAEVTLPAGEHVVTVFWPMPATKAELANAYNDYLWCNIESITVDPKLTVALPTVAEVEACFAPEVYSATDTSLVLRSAAVKYTEGATCLERGDTTGTYEDDPRIDTLLEIAPGQFNASGTEWLWMAYKVNIPADGTYTLGVITSGCKNANYKLPMVVNGEVYTLTFTAAAQTVTAEVTLPAGEHVVTVFWPMPADESEVNTSGDWANYIWCNIASVTVDYSLTISAPEASEVEACFPEPEVEETQPETETTEPVEEETESDGVTVEETPEDDGEYGAFF